MNRDFKGVWIPKEIWTNSELTIMEKLFLVEIDSLDGKKGCFATNAHFADFFQISKGRCTQIIKSLESKKLVKITLIREGKQVSKRVIRVVNKLNTLFNILNTPIKNIKHPYLENDEGSNTSNSNTKEREGGARDYPNSQSLIQDDFKPKESTLIHLKRNGHKPLDSDELEIFISHYQGEGVLKSDWEPVYRKWVVMQRTVFDKNQQRRIDNENQQSAKPNDTPTDRAIRKAKELYAE